MAKYMMTLLVEVDEDAGSETLADMERDAVDVVLNYDCAVSVEHETRRVHQSAALTSKPSR